MNRLTKKIENPQYSNDYEMLCAHDYHLINKLGKIEDIEEEIGIDLITLFKALKQMFVFDEENIKIELLSLHIKSNKLYLYGFVEDTSQVVYLSFEDYKKTWWLKDDKSE